MDWVYLDNNATTRPTAEVARAVQEVHEQFWANPSSIHRLGQLVRQKVELARAAVAGLLQCKPRDVLFTSGGTEANNLALRGILHTPPGKGQAARRVLITARTEHAAIREPAEALAEFGVEVIWLPVGRDGLIAVSAVMDTLARVTAGAAQGELAALVSVQWANNETGVIQPVEEMARRVAEFRKQGPPWRAWVHVDATQAVGKIPVDVGAAPVDLLTLAAHKFHGPKGVGALYVRPGMRLRAQSRGGPQEREKRGGTENVPGIVGMGVAAEQAQAFLDEAEQRGKLAEMRDRFEAAVLEACPGAVVNSATAPRLWNTTNIAFPRLEAEAVLLGLSERGVCASAGAACSSGSLEPSPVLLAMGLPEEIAHGSVRFSLSRFTTASEVERAVAVVREVIAKLGRTLPVGSE